LLANGNIGVAYIVAQTVGAHLKVSALVAIALHFAARAKSIMRVAAPSRADFYLCPSVFIYGNSAAC